MSNLQFAQYATSLASQCITESRLLMFVCRKLY